MARQYVVEVGVPETLGGTGAPDPGTRAPTKTKVQARLRLPWAMPTGTDTTALEGFNVALTTLNGNPRNVADVVRAVYVAGATVRQYDFNNVPAGNYRGWVQAVARGGDSEWVNDAGLTVYDDDLPTIPSVDEEYIQAYIEDFESTVMPKGGPPNASSPPNSFIVTGATYSLASDPGKLVMTRNTNSFSYLRWSFGEWGEYYLDTLRDGDMRVVVKMKLDNANHLTGPFTINAQIGTGDVWSAQFALVNDGRYHIYDVPIGNVTLTGPDAGNLGITLVFNDAITNGATIRIDAIGIAFTNINSALDGKIDRALRARDQFDRYNGLGDFYLQSPIRQPGDPNGNQLIMDANGMFYFRGADGGVHETAYKLGRKGFVKAGPLSSSRITWGGSLDKVDPPFPEPISMNKIRVALEQTGSHSEEVGPLSPARLYLEATEVDIYGMRIQRGIIYGGSVTNYTVNGPWPASAEYKSSLILDPSNYAYDVTNVTNDAWYYGRNDVPYRDGTGLYYRNIIWLTVVTADVRKPNGSPYYVDLQFVYHWGDATLGASSITLDSGYSSNPVRMRVLTDGKTYRMPLVFAPFGWAGSLVGGGNASMSEYQFQNCKVDWMGQAIEIGCPSATPVSLCQMDKVIFDYAYPVAAGQDPVSSSLAGGSYSYIYLEEF